MRACSHFQAVSGGEAQGHHDLVLVRIMMSLRLLAANRGAINGKEAAMPVIRVNCAWSERRR